MALTARFSPLGLKILVALLSVLHVQHTQLDYSSSSSSPECMFHKKEKQNKMATGSQQQ